MLKPNDWNEVIVYGDSQVLPPGGYICEILLVEEKPSKASGKPVLYVQLDIAEGEYFQFFTKKYMDNFSPNKKWSGMAYVATQDKDGKTLGKFKRFIESIEASEDDWVPAWSSDSEAFCESFRGRHVGVTFASRWTNSTHG